MKHPSLSIMPRHGGRPIAMRNSNLPRWQRWPADQLMASIIAISLNFAVVWVLAQDAASTVPPAAKEVDVTQLIFIERERVAAIVRPHSSAFRKTTTVPGPSSLSPAPDQSSRASATAPPSSINKRAVPADPVSTPGRPLNLSVPEPAISFHRNPTVSQRTPIAEVPIRMPLVFVDRSLGGTMKRMTKASICRDLRTALISSPSSAASILASMEHHGCRI